MSQDHKNFYGRMLAAIEDEQAAVKEYGELADLADKLGLPSTAKILREIAAQEQEHFNRLKTWKDGVTGEGT